MFSIYIVDAAITPRDPRFLGAWWLGYAIFGTVLVILSIPLFMFPKNLKEDCHSSSRDGGEFSANIKPKGNTS